MKIHKNPTSSNTSLPIRAHAEAAPVSLPRIPRLTGDVWIRKVPTTSIVPSLQSSTWGPMKRPREGRSTQNSPWSWDHPAISCLFEGTLDQDASCRSLGITKSVSCHFLRSKSQIITDHHKSIQHNLRSKRLSLGSWKPQCCSFLSFLHLQWAERSRVKSMPPVGSTQMFYVILALPILVNSFPFSHTGTANHYTDDLRGCTTGALCPKPVDCSGFLGFVNRVPPVIQW